MNKPLTIVFCLPGNSLGGASQSVRKCLLQTHEAGYYNDGILDLQPSGGTVGIGLTNPSYKLDVSGDIRGTGYRSSDGTAGATADVAVAKVGGGTRTLHFKNGLYTSYTDS
jgi:hypothetical protein